jgi:phospholipid/cholesterol/gamma-HCH transport system substrate-binding protein
MSRAARLGAFIVVTLAVLAAGVFIIGSKEYLFSPTYKLKTQFDNVAGLAAGADVEVGGVHSGTVISIALPHNPHDKVTVVMQLDKSTQEIVKKDSLASIETEGLLGNEYVAVSFGSDSQASVANGDTIASVPPIQMGALLKTASGILDNSQQAIQNATAATAHLNSVSAKIDAGQGTVGALVNDKQLYNNLEQTTAGLQTTVQQAQVGVTDFQENMEALKHNFLLSGFFKKRGYEDEADLTANRISGLPQATPVKTFTYSAKELFDKRDSAKLKHEKKLNDAGRFLADNEFGVAVIEASAGKAGDAKQDQTLTDARAMVVRQYLVGNFGFDDTAMKTLGEGKQAEPGGDEDWGSIKIVIYPEGTAMPAADKPAAANSSSNTTGPNTTGEHAAPEPQPADNKQR